MAVLRVITRSGNAIDAQVSNEFQLHFAMRSARMDGFISCPFAIVPWESIDSVYLMSEVEAAQIKPRDKDGAEVEGNVVGARSVPKDKQN